MPAPIIDIGDGRGPGVELPCPSSDDAHAVLLASPEDMVLLTSAAMRVAPGEPYPIRTTTINGRPRWLYVHRLVCPVAPGLEVDHANRDVRDVRRGNLRAATRSQQLVNRLAPRERRRSQYRGVVPRGAKWDAQIKSNGKRTRVGPFDDEREAARAYDRLARAHFGEFAQLNNVDGSDASSSANAIPTIQPANRRGRAA